MASPKHPIIAPSTANEVAALADKNAEEQSGNKKSGYKHPRAPTFFFFQPSVTLAEKADRPASCDSKIHCAPPGALSEEIFPGAS